MSKYEGRRATEDDVVELAQWAPYPSNRRTSFIQSLLNYVRVPYTRVVVVEKEGTLVAFALLWLKHSAVTQTITAEIKDLVLRDPADRGALEVLLETCEQVVKNMGASEIELYCESLDLHEFGYNSFSSFWRKGV